MENRLVAILMATYNGEKYLSNQILSLQQQTLQEWTLWIKDDGSTDGTIKIIDEFCLLDNRIHKVTSDITGLGAGKNFFSLLPYADAPYTIFCDQDDIWFEKKLEELIGYAKTKLSDKSPGLVYCDGHAYSDNLGVITSSSISHLHAKSLNEFLFFNAGYQGCSILFNRPLTIMAQNYHADFYMHDDIISLLAHTFGEVYFLPKSLMLYRQHATNVTGKTARNFLDMVKKFFRRNATILNPQHYDEKKHFFEYYENILPANKAKLFKAYLHFPYVSLPMRLGIIVWNRFSIGGHHLILILKTLIRKPLP
jgi:glycosyltransferase involved in cell wall biosynthesis